MGWELGVGSVGIRELKQQTSRIIREAQETGSVVDITNRGHVVARLVPVRREFSAADREKTAAALASMDRLAAEIGAHWPKGVSAVDAIREQRREL